MIGGADQDEPVIVDDRHGQFGSVDLALDDPEISLACDDRGGDARRIAFRNRQRNAWIGGAKPHEQRRQPVRRARLACGDREATACQIAEFGERAFGRRRAGERRLCLGQEEPAVRAELDPATDPVEEVRAVARLQHMDGRTDGRWGEPQRGGGLRQMLTLGDRDEDPKLVEGHMFDSIE
jgi:hypothetical protein